MGRLIDADKQIDFIGCGHLRHPGELCFSEIDVVNMLNHAPTAYDVDAVIAQIKERTAFLSDCTKYGNTTKEQQEKSYDTMMMYEVADLIDDLIEIVKGGGIKNES